MIHDMLNYTKKNSGPSTHLVVFTGGEYPVPADTQKYWETVAEPDFVIAADSGLEVLEEYNRYYGNKTFYPDLIIGDMDSIQNISLLSGYPETIVRRCPADKDMTDTELALSYARRDVTRDEIYLTLVGGDGGRIDHFLGIFDLFSTGIHPDAWLCKKQMLFYSCTGDAFFIRNLKPDDYISIARLNGNREGGSISTRGLEWENASFRTEGMPSISNRIKKSFYLEGKPVEITILCGNFVLILPVTAIPVCRRKEK